MNMDGCSGEMNLMAEKIHVIKMKGRDTTETDQAPVPEALYFSSSHHPSRA